MTNKHHCAKFRVNRSNHSGVMAIFRFFKVQNFNCRSSSEGQCASPCQISRSWVKPCGWCGHFSILIMAAVRHRGWFTNVWTTYEEYSVVFVTVQNLVGICAVVSITCKF